MPKPTRTSKNKALPHLAVGTICERALVESDNVVSVIRIVDTITLALNPMPKQGEVAAMALTMLAIFKTGDALGKKAFSLAMIDPSGKRHSSGVWMIDFVGPPEGGAAIRAPLHVLWDKEGLYWFELLIDGTLLTRIPLRISLEKQLKPQGKNKGD